MRIRNDRSMASRAAHHPLLAPALVVAVCLVGVAMAAANLHWARDAEAGNSERLEIVGPTLLFEGHPDFIGIQLPGGNVPRTGIFSLRTRGDAQVEFVPQPDVRLVANEPVDFAYTVYPRVAGSVDIVAVYTYEQPRGRDVETVVLTSPPFRLDAPT